MQCIKCGSTVLIKYGRRKRKIKHLDGTSEFLHIQRYQCKECKTIQSELLSDIVPYKQYSKEAIEYMKKNGMPEYELNDGPSISTVWRYLH